MKIQMNSKTGFIAGCIIMLSLAFLQCYKSAHDLNWTCEVDFDRDMAFAQSAIDGRFGEDPNYKGEFLWYNPLLFLTEASLTKVTGLPLNIILSRGGIYLNLISPIVFLIMMLIFFDFKVALAALLSYLFLATGNILGWATATYSPWLYPVSFMQFSFYLNLIFCYKAFSEQKYSWFALLGFFTGISFLGHTAPALLIILILISVQAGNFIKAAKEKNYSTLKKYLFQGVVTFIPFIIASFPLLYFIIGKYKLLMVNRITFEYTNGIFLWYNFPEMFKENISVSFIIAVVGFIWFYRNFRQSLIRKIILNWFFIVFLLYIYATLVPVFSCAFHIYMPGTVPSFHYFFYLKALQSLFFGFGLLVMLNLLKRRFSFYLQVVNKILKVNALDHHLIYLICILSAIIYYPFYRQRKDFVYQREQAIIRQSDEGKIQMYNFIVKNISEDKVILCEPDASVFPVMATARKMVSINATFSNPYLDFTKRETDRNNILSGMEAGQNGLAQKLLDEYEVSFILLANKNLEKYKALPSPFNHIVYANAEYSLFEKPG